MSTVEDIINTFMSNIPSMIMALANGTTILNLIILFVVPVIIKILTPTTISYIKPTDSRVHTSIQNSNQSWYIFSQINTFVTIFYNDRIKQFSITGSENDKYNVANAHLTSLDYIPISSVSCGNSVIIDIDADNIISKLKIIDYPSNINLDKLMGKKFELKFSYNQTNQVIRNENVTVNIDTINIYGDSYELLELLVKCILIYTKNSNKQTNKILDYYSSDGSYTCKTYGSLVKKTFENSFFNKVNEFKIINTITKWKDNKNHYIEKGLPYKLCFLLYGEPGCGKTSTILSIAKETGKKIVKVNLNDLKNEQLNNIVYANDNSIIVFDDIDAHDVALDRTYKADLMKSFSLYGPKNKTYSNGKKLPDESEANGIKMSQLTLDTLLNILDGNVFLNNCIVIITTNHLKKIDPAIYRPGRVDVMIEFTKTEYYQFNNMMKYYHNVDCDIAYPNFKFIDNLITTSCILNDYILRYDPDIIIDKLNGIFADPAKYLNDLAKLNINYVEPKVNKETETEYDKSMEKPYYSESDVAFNRDIEIDFI